MVEFSSKTTKSSGQNGEKIQFWGGKKIPGKGKSQIQQPKLVKTNEKVVFPVGKVGIWDGFGEFGVDLGESPEGTGYNHQGNHRESKFRDKLGRKTPLNSAFLGVPSTEFPGFKPGNAGISLKTNKTQRSQKSFQEQIQFWGGKKIPGKRQIPNPATQSGKNERKGGFFFPGWKSGNVGNSGRSP